jgi:hypothetical protein
VERIAATDPAGVRICVLTFSEFVFLASILSSFEPGAAVFLSFVAPNASFAGKVKRFFQMIGFLSSHFF